MMRPILLVEDQAMDVDLTLRAFRRRQLANPVEVARDGAEALAWIERWKGGEPLPTLILLDLKLPKVDGLEVLRRLKEHPLTRPVPVVVLTTSSREDDVRAAYQTGANSYIVKPVDFNRFVEVVIQLDLYWNITNRGIE